MDIIKRYQDLPSARHNKNRIVQVLDRNGVLYKSDGEFWSPLDQDASAAWGNINGTLANQADLVAALDGKVGFVQNPVTGGISLSAGGQSIDVGGSSYPAVTIEHLPASTALASTVTPGGIVSRFGFGKQIAIDVTQAGGSSVVGDIEIAWTNDAGASFGAYAKIGDIAAGGTSTVVISMADATGIGFRVRLANVTGTLSGATAGISVRLS